MSSNVAEVEKLRALCEVELGAGASTTRAAALGIFAHHADTPQGIRLSIEHAMKEGLAKFVVCTSTLAQGVNFPLRYLIVTSTRQGGDQILVRDFHNLMGRAGRAGMHTKGSVIFSTPSIYDLGGGSGDDGPGTARSNFSTLATPSRHAVPSWRYSIFMSSVSRRSFRKSRLNGSTSPSPTRRRSTR